jgi:2-oxoglutarate ferredoxin oxidoreductase subunit alpha
LAEEVHGILVVEMSAGQMVEDVRLAVEGRCPVRFYGRMGGPIPLPDEILPELQKLDEELREMRESEMWQAGAAVRSLRPEHWAE